MQPNSSQQTEAQLRSSRANLRPFVKGDPRINRKGRPRSFDELRSLVQKILHETVQTRDGDRLTACEHLLRRMVRSNEPALLRTLLEYGFGKVPEKLETTGLEGRTTLILHFAHEHVAELDDVPAVNGEGTRRLELPGREQQ